MKTQKYAYITFKNEMTADLFLSMCVNWELKQEGAYIWAEWYSERPPEPEPEQEKINITVVSLMGKSINLRFWP